MSNIQLQATLNPCMLLATTKFSNTLMVRVKHPKCDTTEKDQSNNQFFKITIHTWKQTMSLDLSQITN